MIVLIVMLILAWFGFWFVPIWADYRVAFWWGLGCGLTALWLGYMT